MARRSGHTFGDAPTFTYPMLWAFGGAETDQTGKKVVINSKGAIDSVKFMQAFWKECCDEGGLAWDDTNNNRAFHAGEISAHAQRRLDLHRRQAAEGQDQGRQGRAAVDGHRPLRPARRARGTVHDATCLTRTP